MTPEDFEVKIKWSVLQRIAEYYQFPPAVFLCSIKDLPKEKTREDWALQTAKKFSQEIKDLFEKYYEQ